MEERERKKKNTTKHCTSCKLRPYVHLFYYYYYYVLVDWICHIFIVFASTQQRSIASTDRKLKQSNRSLLTVLRSSVFFCFSLLILSLFVHPLFVLLFAKAKTTTCSKSLWISGHNWYLIISWKFFKIVDTYETHRRRARPLIRLHRIRQWPRQRLQQMLQIRNGNTT